MSGVSTGEDVGEEVEDLVVSEIIDEAFRHLGDGGGFNFFEIL